jgi:hypothetical protein
VTNTAPTVKRHRVTRLATMMASTKTVSVTHAAVKMNSARCRRAIYSSMNTRSSAPPPSRTSPVPLERNISASEASRPRWSSPAFV